MENCVFRWFWMCTRKGFWLKWLYAFLIPAVSYCVVAELWLSAGSTYFLSCWETLLESSANFGELWGIVMLKELLGFEVPEGFFFFQCLERIFLNWRNVTGVTFEDSVATSLNYKGCTANVGYLLCVEGVPFAVFLSLILPLLLQSWAGFGGGVVFKGKQSWNETCRVAGECSKAFCLSVCVTSSFLN